MALIALPYPLFVNGTPADGGQVTSDFSTIVNAINGNLDNTNIGAAGIFASQIKGASALLATFTAATVGFAFLPGAIGITPLTVYGLLGQTVDIFGITLTVGGTNALRVTAAGALQVGNGAATLFGDLGVARSATSGAVIMGSTIATAGVIDFGASTVGNVFSMNNGAGAASQLNIGLLKVGLAFGSTAGDIGFARGAATAQMAMGTSSTAAGIVDFGLVNANAYTFRSNPTTPALVALNASAFNIGSDASLKTAIYPMQHGLAEIMALKPSSYTLKSAQKNDLGFIAQDVQAVLPEAVTEDNSGMLGISVMPMVAVAIRSIQQLSDKFDAYVAAHP